MGNVILVHFNSSKDLFLFFLVAQHFVSSNGNKEIVFRERSQSEHLHSLGIQNCLYQGIQF